MVQAVYTLDPSSGEFPNRCWCLLSECFSKLAFKTAFHHPQRSNRKGDLWPCIKRQTKIKYISSSKPIHLYTAHSCVMQHRLYQHRLSRIYSQLEKLLNSLCHLIISFRLCVAKVLKLCCPLWEQLYISVLLRQSLTAISCSFFFCIRCSHLQNVLQN